MMHLSIIEKNSNEKQLITISDLKKGALILELKGEVNRNPTRHSLQIDIDKHLDVPQGKIGKLDYAWAFLNHSCNPNSYINENQLLALYDIATNTELTFDYNTTEYDMAVPFSCNCGSKNCLKEIRGYKYLNEKQKAIISKFTPFYLETKIKYLLFFYFISYLNS